MNWHPFFGKHYHLMDRLVLMLTDESQQVLNDYCGDGQYVTLFLSLKKPLPNGLRTKDGEENSLEIDLQQCSSASRTAIPTSTLLTILVNT